MAGATGLTSTTSQTVGLEDIREQLDQLPWPCDSASTGNWVSFLIESLIIPLTNDFLFFQTLSIKVTFRDSKGNDLKTVEGNEGDDLLSIAHEYDIDLEGERASILVGRPFLGASLTLSLFTTHRGLRRLDCMLYMPCDTGSREL
jgi:hypothetical protein